MPNLPTPALTFLLAATFAAAPLSFVMAETLTLVKEQRPTGAVVIDPAATKEERKAAQQFIALIKARTGAELSVLTEVPQGAALIIGKHSQFPEALPSDLDADGFIYRKVAPEQLQILGPTPRATAHAVVDLLERHAEVRWLLPGPLGVDFPSAESFEVPLAEYRDQPVFLSRALLPTDHASEADREWAAANRLFQRVDASHGMRKLFPVTEFGTSHPEFYPFVDGERLIPPPGPRFRGDRAHYLWQPNFTAPGITDAAAKQIDGHFQKNPAATSFPLGLNDGAARFDQSPESLKRRSGRKNSMNYEDMSDDYFLFANEVASKVTAQHPDKWLGTLAYREITDPPAPEIGVHERIVPFMTQDRLRWIDPALKEADQKRTLQWAGHAKALGWYDYQYGASYQIPRIYPHIMKEALLWASENGVRFYVAELYPNWGEGPKPWLIARLLWNPNADVDHLLTEWYERAGGKEAAPLLAEYYSIWEKFWTENILNSPWWHPRGPYLSYYDKRYLAAVPPELIERCDTLLEEALAKADPGPREARVRFLRDIWQNWYRPNLVIYQAEHLPLPAVTSEEEALAEVKRVALLIQEAGNFRETLQTWGKERPASIAAFYSEPEVRNISSLIWKVRDRLNAFSFDGTALLWRLRPWITSSPKVAEAFAALAQDPQELLRENARIVLAAAQQKGKPLTSNSSFEEGLSDWAIEPNISPFPSDYPFNDAHSEPREPAALTTERAHTGKQALRISAWREAGKTDVMKEIVLQRDLPYQSGSYYGEVYALQEKGIPASPGHLTLQAIDANDKVIKLDLPTGSITAGIGEWRENTQSFTLPDHPQAKTLRVTLTFKTLTPLGDFDARQHLYIDDIAIHRVETP